MVTDLQKLSTYRSQLMGISILLIMLFHSIRHIESDYAILVKRMNVAVEYFLLLSSIGLYYSLSKRPQTTAEFYKKRLLRILPTYLLCAVPIFFYIDVIRAEKSAMQELLYFICDVTMIGEFFGRSLLWFIPTILLCYLSMPFLYRLLIRSPKGYALLTVAAVVFCYGWIYLLGKPELIFTRYAYFVVTVSIAKLVVENKTISYMPLIVLLSLVLFSSTFFCDYQVLSYRFICLLTSFPLLYLFSFLLHTINSKLLNRVLSFLGTITLELYLLHELVFWQICRSFIADPLLCSFISIVLSIPAAYCLHRVAQKL